MNVLGMDWNFYAGGIVFLSWFVGSSIIKSVGNMMLSVVLDGNPLDEDDGNLLDEVVFDA